MEPWPRSSVTMKRMEGLVKKGLLRPRTDAMEWILPGDEVAPAPPDGYVVSLVRFHERGFGMPPHPFFRGLLHHYGVELHHLNPNGVQHMAAFVTLCEAFLGIAPHFDLWTYFFAISLHEKKERNRPPLAVPVGCASVRLRQGRSREYIPVLLTTSNKGWHDEWFYLKNDVAAPLPIFTGRLFDQAPSCWHWGPPERQRQRLEGILAGVRRLRLAGVNSSGVIGAYHVRRLAPLMARRLPMWGMTPGADLAGTAMVEGVPLSVSEVRARLAEATGQSASMGSDYAILLGHAADATPTAAIRAAEGAADGVAGVAHGIGSDAEEAQGHRGSQRRVHSRPQGPALSYPGGGTQAWCPRRCRRGLRRVPPCQEAFRTRGSPRGEEFRRRCPRPQVRPQLLRYFCNYLAQLQRVMSASLDF